MPRARSPSRAWMASRHGEEQLTPLLPKGAQLHHVVSLRLWVLLRGWITSEQLWCRRLWRGDGRAGQGLAGGPRVNPARKGASNLPHQSSPLPLPTGLPAHPDAHLPLQVPSLHPAHHLLNLHLLSHVPEAHQCRQGEPGLGVRKKAGLLASAEIRKYFSRTARSSVKPHPCPLSWSPSLSLPPWLTPTVSSSFSQESFLGFFTKRAVSGN